MPTTGSGGRDDAAAAVLRWLGAGRDVVLRGERGSGRTATLEALRADLSDRRLTGLLLRASGPTPFAAVLDHPSAPPRAPDETALTAWLADELAAPRSVLLVDDADRVDPGTLRVVRRALQRTGCRLVAAATADPLRAPPGPVRDLVVARSPAEVRLAPLGLGALSALAADSLGGTAGAALTATLHAQTGGNPGAAVALLAAARATGALRRDDGRHVDDGRLASVPAEVVASLLLGALDEERVDALERLAVAGPVPPGVAARLVDPALLDDLAEHGRVAEHDGAGGLLVVTPPALARALRDRVGAARRRRLLAAAREVAGDGPAGIEPARADLGTLLARDAAGSADFLRWSTQVAGVVHERAAAAESAACAAWVAEPRLGTANAYLALLMRRPARDRIAGVLRDTARAAADTAEDDVVFRYHRARWTAWPGARAGGRPGAEAWPAAGADLAGPGDPGPPPSDDDDAVGPLRELDDLKQRLVEAIRDGAPAEAVAAADPVAVPVAAFRGASGVLRAAALLEAGRPDLALAVPARSADGDVAPGAPGDELRHYRAALHGESLALLGRLADAERHEHTLLSAAYDAYDAVGIRVHGAVLAEVLLFAGEEDAAWRVLSTALRLGPPGPVGTTFHRRALALGAVLQVGAGRVDLARALLRELEEAPRDYRPLLRSLRVMGAVALAAATGDRPTATEIAWRAGLSYAGAGLRQPALLTWAFAPPPLTPERAATVRAARADAVLPLLDPYLDLQLALADGDEAATAAALPRVHPRVGRSLVAAAHGLLGTEPAGGAGGRPPRPGRPEPLSDREREVAALGRDGLSNREIAARLHLSVRTVENHMSRALRKLGHRSRADLRGWAAG
ncbi:helix-turn-helix transcriptional regulator [Cellulomonas pakistanensis]|uniref:HTH luxR-type domain-containing protein n=1 Tax=Cellulomonas pakistanensis TaxID=992287 RepID=A0A919U4B8_9CELL|nr:LuxR C-terminal-related transcriptional regulator [Cellulomonas pakistanensis]GIG37316.1 hypothetical protein Cpa01nite_26970 [Cellulomonas pakistanensis]